MPRVFNKNLDVVSYDAIYIGRLSKFGNPFEIGKDGTRREVVEKFRKYLFSNQKLLDDVKKELYNKDLVCFCLPKLCHGNILIEVANSLNIFEDLK